MKYGFMTALIAVLNLFYSEAQVNLQTGAAQFSLPMYSYSDANNRIGTSISLVYTAGSGLKVSEIPSCVGAGWNLTMGGVITRNQRGEADDQDNPNYSISNPNYFPDGWYYSPFSAQQPVGIGASYQPLGFGQLYIPDKILTDREQDVYSFSFNGRSGEFVFGKGETLGRSIVDSKLKIEKIENQTNASIRTKISAFKITDELGIQYVFQDLELSEVLHYTNTATIQTSQNDYLKVNEASGIDKYIVSKWFLSEIVNPLTNQKITFNYESYSVDMVGPQNYTELVPNNAILRQKTFTVSKIKGITQRVLSIICSPKERVNFSYSGIRADVPSEKRLDEISVSYDGQVKHKYKFTHQYFLWGDFVPALDAELYYSSGTKRYMRLCLKSVYKIGENNVSEAPYLFDYFLGQQGSNAIVPAIFSLHHDHYGYSNSVISGITEYNGDNSQLSLNSLYLNVREMALNSQQYRAPSDKQAQVGILKSIKYPNGGSLTFEFEQNTALNASNVEVMVGGVHVAKTTLHDGNDPVKDILTEYKYVKPLAGSSVSSAWGYEDFVYSRNKVVEIERCGNAGPMTPLNVTGSPGNMHAFSAVLQVSSGNQVKDVAQVLFPHQFEWVWAIVNYLNSLSSDPFTSYNTTEYSSTSLNGHNTLPIQYSRVEITNKLGTTNTGKAIYEFTSPVDHPIFLQSLNWPYASRPRYAYWAYGLPKTLTIKDKFDFTIKEVKSFYNFFKDPLPAANYGSQMWEPWQTIAHCWDPDLLNSDEDENITRENYSPLVGRAELYKSEEYLFSPSQQGTVLTTTFYSYNSDYQLSQTITKNSKYEEIETNIYYPNDYTVPGPIQSLRNNHILAVPISTQTFIKKNFTSKYLISGSFTEYGVLSNGDVKPVNYYNYEGLQPAPLAQVQFSSNQLNPNPSLYRLVKTVFYNNGILENNKSDAGESGAFYDYDGKLPVAVISNAKTNDVSYASFEAENSGNWIYDQSKIASEFSPTGKKCFKFSNQAATITSWAIKGFNPYQFSTDVQYTLSFWAKDGSPYVAKMTAAQVTTNNGITLAKTYTNIATGWTYYEYKIVNGAPIVMSNDKAPNGTSYSNPASFYIDEIRLFPSNSTITTATYDPLIGKTSECDINNRIVYYEYDDLGRLKTVRDENRNIVKTYQYNHKQ
jgi:hypothetical protein